MLKILKIGDFIKTGNYKVHSSFRQHVNLVSDNRLITITDRSDDIGPLNMIITNADLPRIRSVSICNNFIKINDVELEIFPDLIYRSHIHQTSYDFGTLVSNSEILKNKLLNSSKAGLQFLFDLESFPSPESNFIDLLRIQFNKGLKSILAGDFIKGIQKFKGRGIGLTPSGDDFIAGLLYGLFIVGRSLDVELEDIRNEIHTQANSTNLITNNYLYLAREGRFYQDFKILILALSSGNPNEIDQSTDHILSRGESSGADMLTGFIIMIQNHKNILSKITQQFKRGANGK